jgi:anaerobic ribonucleoside-triphosphate reductase
MSERSEDRGVQAGTRIRAVRTEVYSRVVGYYRPVQDWNRGKREEFEQREYVSIGGVEDSGR